MQESTPAITIGALKSTILNAPYPIILCDNELRTVAYSESFRHCFLAFSGELSGLIGAKEFELIRAARENCCPVCIRCGKRKSGTVLQISWLCAEGAEQPLLLGMAVEGRDTADEQHVSIAYSCVMQSDRPLHSVFSTLEFGKRSLASGKTDDVAEAFDRIESSAMQLLRHNLNLHSSLDALTGTIVQKKECADISTILAAVTREVKKAAAANEIKIYFKRPHMPVVLHCDVTQLTRAIAGCLYSLLCFTQHGGRILIKLTYDKKFVTVEMTDPVFSMPEEMRERVLFQDVIVIDGHRCGGLYHPLTIIDRHGGTLETAACKPLGQRITVKLPLPEPDMIAMCQRDLDDYRAMIAFWTRLEFNDYK